MNLQLKIVKVGLPEKSNSSSGRWAIPVDIKYIDGIGANTFKYTWKKKEALKLYTELINKINKTISIYDL